MNLQTRQHRRSGVALLVAITTVAMLSIMVTEITYIARMRLMTATFKALGLKETCPTAPNEI